MKKKYRAWDYKSKRMLEVSNISFDIAGEVSSVMVFGLEEDNKKRIEGGGSVSITAEGKPFIYGTLELGLYNGFELLQYIGLKDKNGKEIYCGDILKSAGDNVIVEWYFNRWIFRNISGRKEEILREYYYFFEVIGNIYENPNLIK